MRILTGTMRRTIPLCLLSSLILHPSSLVFADGGAIRFSDKAGNYRITVFSAPTPLRAGPVDISVLVQDAPEQPLPDIQVTVKATWQGVKDFRSLQDFGSLKPATKEAATNKLYYAAHFDWPEPGWYAVEVFIDGPLGQGQARFDVEAGDPPPQWLGTWAWIAWPVLCILLFGVHQWLVRRRDGRK